MDSAVLPDLSTEDPGNPQRTPPVPSHVARHLLTGTSALGTAILIERGMGFLGNILGARLGGASTFGAYSLAITTANNISTYAAGGIGATAARFSGKYPRGTSGYGTLARVLAIVSVVSALVAIAGLWAGASPLAHLLQKDSLTGMLRWASVSAAGIILLECARGFFVGQRLLLALILLSVIVGIGMVTLLPLAATRHDPVRMIISQGAITTGAVLVCLLLSKPLGLFSPDPAIGVQPIAPMLREVWSFGMVQLAGLVGANLAGWWLASLVARSDTTLVQMGFFSIASQLRNIVGLAPSLLTESSYAVMAGGEGEHERTPDRVMAFCTYASTIASMGLAALGILVVPWALQFLYGRSYAGASTTTAIALAIAVIHMGNAPAAARLTIVSIRTAGAINTVWAIFVALSSTAFLLHGGSAWKGMAIYLVAHLLSGALVLSVLHRKRCVPEGVSAVFGVSSTGAVLLALLSMFRARYAGLTLPLTVAMLLVFLAAMYVLALLGRRFNWLPDRTILRRLAGSIRAKAEGLRTSRTSHGA